MKIIEMISMFQRMLGAVKTDVEAGKTLQALSKIEIFEGELGIFRVITEEKNEEKKNKKAADSRVEELVEKVEEIKIAPKTEKIEVESDEIKFKAEEVPVVEDVETVEEQNILNYEELEPVAAEVIE